VTVGHLGAKLADGAVAAGLEAGRVFRCETAEAAADILAGRLQAGDAVLFKASRGVHLEAAVDKMISLLGKAG
jgi:UDP-N-acetylmuramoyl-tripeptide--D-alanyl-D-alanine ligase